MLTVAYVLFGLQILNIASCIVREEQGIKIALTKRSALNDSDRIVAITSQQQIVAYATNKYEHGFEVYEGTTGEDLDSRSSPVVQVRLPLLSGSVFLNVTNHATGADALTDDKHGELWQGAIIVGFPAQGYTLYFDTGSGSSCKTNYQGHTAYNLASSSTSVDCRKNYTLNYGIAGEKCTDMVDIAGLKAKQALGASNTYSGFAKSDFPPDGLLGTAYQSISDYDSLPVFQDPITQRKTIQPIFAFKLAKTDSELYLGGVDSTLYMGSSTYAPITDQRYWQVNMQSVTSDNEPSVDTIVDTGTTLVLGDSTNVRKLYATITGSEDATATVESGFYTVPCTSIPTVNMAFAGKAFTISPVLFNLGQVHSGSKDCIGGIVGSSMSF